MTKESLMNTLKWIIADILVPLAVGISAVYVAVKANQISELQAQITKTSEQPVFEIYGHPFDEPASFGDPAQIDIAVLDGKYSNYHSAVRTFLVCRFDRSNGELRQPAPDKIEIPVNNFYSFSLPGHSLYGNVESLLPFNTLGNLKDLQAGAKEYYQQAPDLSFTTSVETCLKITYTNLLDEQETVYFLVDSEGMGLANQINEEYGADLFQKWQDMSDSGLAISMSMFSEVPVSELLRVLDHIHAAGAQYTDSDAAILSLADTARPLEAS